MDRKDASGLTALQYAVDLEQSDCAAAIFLAGGQLPLSLNAKPALSERSQFSKDTSGHQKPNSLSGRTTGFYGGSTRHADITAF